MTSGPAAIQKPQSSRAAEPQSRHLPAQKLCLTNFFVTPFAFALAATPMSGTSNNGGIGQLAGAGVSWEHNFTKNLSMELGGFYEDTPGRISLMATGLVCWQDFITIFDFAILLLSGHVAD